MYIKKLKNYSLAKMMRDFIENSEVNCCQHKKKIMKKKAEYA